MRSLIVGMHFRPPAKALITCAPENSALTLFPEPSNPYDEFAIKVFLHPNQWPESTHAILAEALPHYGFELEEILNLGPIHIGYIASKCPKGFAGNEWDFAPQLLVVEGTPAKLKFTASGQPFAHSTFGHRR
jgi:hypothetical protein